MCTECGCSSTDHSHHHEHESRTIRVEEDLLAKNNRLAAGNRQLFTSSHLLVLNLVSSPGSGKTSLLERTLADLKRRFNFSVLEGDQQTTNDADRIAATGVPVKQLNTGAGCHLDAHMVGHGVESFDLAETDILMIENVGNLVCPAAFDLGEDHKVTVLSVTEGEDKPLKYPQMFQACDLMLINKIDLLPYLNFDLEQCKAFARQINPRIEIMELSCQTGAGMQQWYDWLMAGVARKNPGRRGAGRE
ncbi:MAG: hydrogenase nickel incorporation protein HypB [Desulfuromonadales bacterium]|jgi:hydrogenase nickel incorporation protein HypB|nr:hydrogenase nickel incorporation protein HypB [Deltaproteobacteria bacterium]MDH4007521.1 hydrogenase nickel incorporation protein HypB [Desulfuromonadales bacterium]